MGRGLPPQKELLSMCQGQTPGELAHHKVRLDGAHWKLNPTPTCQNSPKVAQTASGDIIAPAISHTLVGRDYMQEESQQGPEVPGTDGDGVRLPGQHSWLEKGKGFLRLSHRGWSTACAGKRKGFGVTSAINGSGN